MFGLRALGALPYTGRPETAVSGAVKWYLNNTTSVSAIVRIPDIIVGATVGDYIEFKAVASAGNPSNAYRMMGASNNNWTDLIELNPSAIFFRAGGNNSSISTAAGYTQPALGIIFTFKAVKASSSTWQIFLNGSPVGSPLANGGSITVGSLFAVQGPTTIESFRGGVYYVAFSTNGGVSATRYYDPSVGNGGSTTLIDTIGGQHGTYTGEWVTGARYMPYLDTTVSTPIVNQGVNGTANYFCTLNGTSYFTTPTLGNLLTGSPKIRINIKKFKQFGSSVEPVFWQGGNSWGTRELALRNNSSLGNIIIGGVATGFTWSDLTNAFGDPNLTCDEFGFEINGTNAIFYKNKVAVFTVPNLSKGTSRLDGALLFFGAQPANDNAGSTAAISIVPNGMQYGDIEIFINDVLVRNYKNTNGSGAGYVDVLQPRPFALRYNAGGNRYMALPQAIIIANNQDFEIEFECAFNNDTDFRIFGATAGVNNRVILLKGTGATVVRLTPTGGNANEWTVTYTKTEFNVFRFKRVSNVIELFVNGVSQGTKTEADGFTSGINSLFMQGGFYSDSGTVRFLKFTIGGVLQHHYVNLTGSGTSWTDIVSGNNATPINTWPTDNSQWIEYAHLQQRGTFTIDNSEWRQYVVFNVVSNIKEGGGVSAMVVNTFGAGHTLRRGGAVSSAAINTIGSGNAIRIGGAPVTFAYTLTGGNKTVRRGGAVSTLTFTTVGGGEVIKNTIAYNGGAAITFSVGLTGGGQVIRRGGSLMTFATNSTGGGHAGRRGGGVSSVVINTIGSGITRRIGGASATMSINVTDKTLVRRNGGGVSAMVVNTFGAGHTIRVGGGDIEFTVIVVGGGENLGQGYKPTVTAPVITVSRRQSSPSLIVGKHHAVTYNLKINTIFRGQTCIL